MNSLNPGCSHDKVKKRRTIYDNEIIQNIDRSPEHQFPLPNDYGDRFIPRRKNLNSKPEEPETQEKNNWCSGFKLKYKQELDKIFGVTDCRLMRLSDPIVPRLFFPDKLQNDQNFYFVPRKQVTKSSNKYANLDWNCNPRMKPIMDVDSSHEFEGFSSFSAVGSLIEWTWTGHIVVYCEDSILFWNPNEDVITKYDIKNVLTLAYNPCYSLLATTNTSKREFSLNVWSFNQTIMGKYFTYKSGKVSITSLCWHKYGIYLVCGTKDGHILTLDVSGDSKKVANRSYCEQSVIKDIKFSATHIFLAALDVKGKLAIWYWSGGCLKIVNSWESRRPTLVSIDWHPWHDYDIAICIKRTSSILIQNIKSGEIEAFCCKKTGDFRNPVISFNKVSAEMVVSCMVKDDAAHRNNGILVLGAIDRVVDTIPNAGVICTKFMWSPNGSQLAFISGNDIQIFNFFGTTTKKIPKKPSNVLNFSQNQSIFKDYDYVK